MDDKTTGSKDNNPNGPGCEDGAKAKAVKEKLAKALSDDEAAWGEYVQQYGAGSVLKLAAGPKTQALTAAARANAFKHNFKAALHEMDRLNREAEAAGDDAVAFGINSQAHLNAEDFAALRTTGLSQAAAPDAGRKLKQACSSSSGNVPYALGGTSPAAAVNWLASGFVTPVQDQGTCGACATFATSVLTEFVLMKRSALAALNSQPVGFYTSSSPATDLSESDLMECDHVVVVVGYFTSGGIPYFLAKNSWGTGWGDAGYIRLQSSCNINKRSLGPFAMLADSPTVPVL
ncbi:hypothetical protein OEZ85_011423 [Tetradesmus obliquus]|uniref:Peptidase C1A papain C-terminal domain-containing protein n=1 Tax=Tetradesmus obliquus TaxID=3088 RepID=A0ABY8TQP2_TETOB|nr:hypothetical protein OEZ85_011423 [Tetradesmus obliquus]